MDKILKNRLIKESSFPGTLTMLLENDVKKAKKTFDAILKGLASRESKAQSLISSLPSGNYQDTLAANLETATGPLDVIKSKFEAMSDDEGSAAKEIGALLAQADDISKQISYILKINRGAMSYMARQVLDSKLHQGDDKDIPMTTILADNELLDQAKEELGAAIKDALNSAQVKKKKGFFSKMAGKLFGSSSLDIDSESKEEMISGILELSPIEIGKFAQAIVSTSKSDEQAADSVESETEKVTSEIEDEAGVDDEAETDDTSTDDDGKTGSSMTYGLKDFISRVEKATGPAGGLIVKKMISDKVFDNIGIKFESSLRDKTMSFLLEETLPAKDFEKVYSSVIEDDPDFNKGRSPQMLATGLNTVFKDNDYDIQIDVDGIDEDSDEIKPLATAGMEDFLSDERSGQIGNTLDDYVEALANEKLLPDQDTGIILTSTAGKGREEALGTVADPSTIKEKLPEMIRAFLEDGDGELLEDFFLKFDGEDYSGLKAGLKSDHPIGELIQATIDEFNEGKGTEGEEAAKEDVDNDGTPDGEQDTDDDGVPNSEDDDDDGDGTPDEKDESPTGEEEKSNEYTIREIEDLISKAFKASSPDWENEDFADTMVMALSTYIQEEVDEVSVISEGRLMIYEKYDYEAVKDYITDQMAGFDFGQKDEYGTEDFIFSQFLTGVAPALSKIGVEISGIPDEGAAGKDGEDDESGDATDDKVEEIQQAVVEEIPELDEIPKNIRRLKRDELVELDWFNAIPKDIAKFLKDNGTGDDFKLWFKGFVGKYKAAKNVGDVLDAFLTLDENRAKRFFADDETAKQWSKLVGEKMDLLMGDAPETAYLADGSTNDSEKGLVAKKGDDGILVPLEGEEAIKKAGITIEESKFYDRLRLLAGIK